MTEVIRRFSKYMAVFICIAIFFAIGGCGSASSDRDANASEDPISADDTSDGSRICSMSINCEALLTHIDRLDESKLDFVPDDGVILDDTEYIIEDDDTVFDILQRACRDNDIAMEYSTSAVYDTEYVEGIGQLYEFDAGPLSGWMYTVNGEYPNYGAGRYRVQNGDVIVWLYSVDMEE